MKPKIELRQSRDFGQIVSDAILFVIQNWKSLFKTYLVFKIVSIHNSVTEGGSGFSARMSLFGYEYYLTLAFGFLNGIAIIISTLCYMVLYKENDNTPPSMHQVWVYFKYYFFRVSGAVILLLIIFFIVMVICIIPVYFLTIALGQWGSLIGVFVLMVPLIYFITILSLFFPIMITENTKFGYTFSKCFKLAKGKWWCTFGVIFVMAVLVYVMYLFIIVPFSLISGGTTAFLSYNVSGAIVVLYCIFFGIIQVINIVPMIASSVAYFSYVEDKESIGLMERIETLGVNDAEESADDVNDEY